MGFRDQLDLERITILTVVFIVGLVFEFSGLPQRELYILVFFFGVVILSGYKPLRTNIIYQGILILLSLAISAIQVLLFRDLGTALILVLLAAWFAFELYAEHSAQ